MAQPLHIPILYTGEQVAVPDWKGLGKNIRESYRRASENRKEKQRYEQVRNDRMAREILSELDVADVNFTNEQVQAIQTQLYGGLEQGLTNIIKDKKGESRKDLGVADYAQAKSLTTKYNQEISKYKISEQIRNDDLKIMYQKPDNYTKEAIQKAERWDYKKNGVYTADNLGKSLRVYGLDELAEKDKREAKDADYVATQVAFKNGVEETKKIDLEKQFYTVEGGVPTLKEDAAIEYMAGQYALPSRQQDLNSVTNHFDKLPDIKKQEFIDKYGKDEAPVAWYTVTNKDKIFPVAYNVRTEPIDETKGTLGSGVGGADVYTPNNSYVIAGTTYDNTVKLPKNIKTGGSKQIVNSQEESGDKLSNPKTSSYKDPEIEAITTDGKGNADKVVFKAREEKFKYKNGEPVYDISGIEGTEAELKVNPKLVGFADSWDFLFNDKHRAKEEGGYKTVIAPAKDNKWVFDEVSFKGFKGFTENKKEEKKTTGVVGTKDTKL